MQDKDVRAFRQRLIRAGFKEVSITCYRDEVYLYCRSYNNEIIKRRYKLEEVKNYPVVKYVL